MSSSTALKTVDRAVLKTCKGWCCSSSAGRFEEHSQQCFHWDSKLGPEGKKYYGLPIFCQVWGGGVGGGGMSFLSKVIGRKFCKILRVFKKSATKVWRFKHYKTLFWKDFIEQKTFLTLKNDSVKTKVGSFCRININLIVEQILELIGFFEPLKIQK